MCQNETPEGRTEGLGQDSAHWFLACKRTGVIWESLLTGAGMTVAVLAYRLWAQRKARETRLMIKRIAYLEWPGSEGME